MGKDRFWRKVIQAKYGVRDRGWNSSIPNGSEGTSLWKGISKEWCFFGQDRVKGQ